MLPRIDVGYSAMAGAFTGLALLALNYLVFNNPVGLAALPTLLVVAATGVVAYAVPKSKELAGGIAGAAIVLVEAYLSSRTGDAIDVGTVTAAVTYLVQLLLLHVLPRIQVLIEGTNRPERPARSVNVRVDAQ